MMRYRGMGIVLVLAVATGCEASSRSVGEPGSCVVDSECDDGDPCTRDLCRDDPRRCTQEPMPDTTPCWDDNPCTTGDQCRAGTCVGTPADCNDGDACTQDLCEPTASGTAAFTCNHPAVDCDDGSECSADSCDPDHGCVHAINPDLEGLACHEGCPGGFCGDGMSVGACRQGECLPQASCAMPPTPSGPTAAVATLVTPDGGAAAESQCFDFTGDGVGDNGLGKAATSLNPYLADDLAVGRYSALFEFPAGTDLANAVPFRLKALTGQPAATPIVPGATFQAAPVSYQSDCDTVDRFVDASIADGLLEASTDRIWVRMPGLRIGVVFIGIEDWPALIRVRQVRVRARVAADGSGGVEMTEGVLGGLITEDDLRGFLDRVATACAAAPADSRPEHCQHLGAFESGLPLAFNLHCTPGFQCQPKSRELRGNAASVCLLFTAIPAVIDGVLPAS